MFCARFLRPSRGNINTFVVLGYVGVVAVPPLSLNQGDGSSTKHSRWTKGAAPENRLLAHAEARVPLSVRFETGQHLVCAWFGSQTPRHREAGPLNRHTDPQIPAPRSPFASLLVGCGEMPIATSLGLI